MKAIRLINERVIISETTFAELVVWKIPEPAAGSKHLYKYRLALVIDQECVLRYDNEPGKGDHKHIGEVESSYEFTTPEKLLANFWKDVEAIT